MNPARLRLLSGKDLARTLARGPARPFAVGPTHVFTVNSTSDTHNLPASNTSHVCSDASGKCTIRAAIDAANSDTGPDKIVIPPGTYTLTLGSLDPAVSMLIVGAGASKTIIDGANAFGVFVLSGTPSPTVEIDNVQIRHGSSTNGGAIALNRGSLTLGSDILTLNNASQDGGAVYDAIQASGIWMSNTTVSGNTAANGGGLYVTGGFTHLSNDMIGGTAAGGGNIATDLTGGGIYSDFEGILSLANTHVDWNLVDSATVDTASGGGIYEQGALYMQGGSISHNVVSTGVTAAGGGLANLEVAQIDGAHIDGNKIEAGTGGQGGGIWNAGRASVTSSTANNNSVTDRGTGHEDDGGGVYDLADFGQLLWTGGSISGNSIVATGTSGGLTGYGGGVYDAGGAAISGAQIDGNTVTGQTAASTAANQYISGGAGVYTKGSMALSQDTIKANTASNYAVLGTAAYIDSADTTSATGLNINNNAARAVDHIKGGAIYAPNSFTLGNSTVNGQSNTVTGAGAGNIDGGFAYFGGTATLDSDTVEMITNTVLGSTGQPLLSGGVMQVSGVAHLNNVTVSTVSNSVTAAAGAIEASLFFSGNSDLNAVSISGVTNTVGNAGSTGASIEYGVFFQSGGAKWQNVAIDSISNSAAGTQGTVNWGVGEFASVASLGNVDITQVKDIATGTSGGVFAGGLYFGDPRNGSPATLENIQINGVTATAGLNGFIDGGALYAAGEVTVNQGTVANVVAKTLGTAANSATSRVQGGAIFAESPLDLTNVTLAGDRAISAGTGTAGAYGGAINADAPVLLTNDTLTGNTASRAGGAVYSGNEAVTFKNTIVAGNASAMGSCDAFGAGLFFFSAGNNLGSDASCAFTNIGDQIAAAQTWSTGEQRWLCPHPGRAAGQPRHRCGKHHGLPRDRCSRRSPSPGPELRHRRLRVHARCPDQADAHRSERYAEDQAG